MKSLLERMDDFEKRLERLERLVGDQEGKLNTYPEEELAILRKCYDLPKETYDDSESYY